MHSSRARIVIAACVFVVALGAGLLLLRGGAEERGESTSSADDGSTASPSATSIWKVGDTWTVRVRQDAGAITPDGTRSIAEIPFRFRVADGPEDDTGHWSVRVVQDGAEGPFAQGWTLRYEPSGDALVLDQVATGDEPPLEAELAAIVLGPQFPYEVRYTKAPSDAVVDADRLMARAQLPPTILPGQGDDASGRRPPDEAPPLPDDAGPAAPPR